MKRVLFFLLLLAPGLTSGQIHLRNASFEGDPQDATVPVAWLPCERGTTPDILPGFFGVFTEPSEGETFVGLITREDGSWESIAQRLDQPLHGGECYEFSLDLARSTTYADYNQPIKLRVWAGRAKCSKDQLLLETGYIDHINWENYETQFAAESALHYLILEAHYREGPFSHKGNILIDNISPIKECARAMAGK